MPIDSGLINILGQTAYSNNPNLIQSDTSNSTIGGLLFGLGRKKQADPNREIFAQNIPEGLHLNQDDLLGIVKGAVNKQPMSPAFQGVQKDFNVDVDTTGLGHYGEVNSNASPKKDFWNTKGGNIASSLLGMVALGLLGAGIGAIGGGRKGAASGAAQGLGFGLMQDMGLRKQGIESQYNQQKSAIELAQLQNKDKSEMEKSIEFLRANPSVYQKDPATGQSLTDIYSNIKNPYGEANLMLRAAGLGLQGQKYTDEQARKLTESTKGSNQVLSIADSIKSLTGFDPLDVDYITDQSGKTKLGLKSTGENVPDVPGMNVWGLGRVTNYPLAPSEGKMLDSEIGKILQFTVYDQSGKAISIPEMETFKRNYLNNRYSSEAEMIYGAAQALRAAQKVAAQLESGYSDKTLKTVQERGGNIISKGRIDSSLSQQEAAKNILRKKGISWE